MADLRPYEIYAIKYGDHQRLASENFIGGDPHNGPMPIDYFVWAVKGADKTWVVDTGIPKWAVPTRTLAAVVSAANPWIGSSWTTRWPIVCMIRQPPTAVPSESAVAETTMTQ